MFAIYWPVMAFVAAIVLIISVMAVSLSNLCRARLEPLPERDLATYLPEDDNDVAAFQEYEQQNGDFSLEMDYPSYQ